tara:strand:+ start:388 stop:882 length:495 start_codon:yes stop_codon:yes gene_type:complete
MEKKNKKNIFIKVNEFSGKLSSILVFLLILLVSLSVLLRYVFSIGFTWLQDLYIWVHACFILLGIGYTLSKDGHVRIDIIYRNLNEKSRKIVNFCGALLFGLPVCYIIIFEGYQYFYRSFLIGENSKETGGLANIYILKFFIFLMGILLLCELINRIYNFLKND